MAFAEDDDVIEGFAPDRNDQPDPAGMGELLRHREREPMLSIRAPLGRAKSTASPGSSAPVQRLRLEAVE